GFAPPRGDSGAAAAFFANFGCDDPLGCFWKYSLSERDLVSSARVSRRTGMVPLGGIMSWPWLSFMPAVRWCGTWLVLCLMLPAWCFGLACNGGDTCWTL